MEGMKKLMRICAMALLLSVFFLTPAAMAVVIGGSQVLAPFSEPGAMLLLGTSLIGIAGLCRNKVLRK
jgi:P pilus assembly chaperone PapD